VVHAEIYPLLNIGEDHAVQFIISLVAKLFQALSLKSPETTCDEAQVANVHQVLFAKVIHELHDHPAFANLI
jgi:hypothetical protein